MFYVAKDLEKYGEKVLGIAMWMKPRRTDDIVSWGEWVGDKWEGWKLWFQQVGMNLWYGRGGLNVKVRLCSVSYFSYTERSHLFFFYEENFIFFKVLHSDTNPKFST